VDEDADLNSYEEPLTAAILLVDDRPANLLALEAVLEPLGHKLVLARSGEEALRQLLQQDFALILMDVQMPGLDGFQTVALIKKRERSRDIPVIFVTAIAREAQEIAKGYAYGAVDYMTKPFDTDILKAKVSCLVALYLQAERIVRQQTLLERQRQRVEREHAGRQAAETASRIKDEFLAMVSHELRAPLNAILGWADMLQSGHLDEDRTRHALVTIQRNARMQTQLIEDLLDVSRIVRGRLRLDLEPVHLVEIVQDAIDSVRPAADAAGVTLAGELDPSADEATGDPQRLRQVVWNLISNAVKFTPRGGHVAVSLQRVLPHVEIVVRDSGRGILPQDLPYLFERFWQGQKVGPNGTRAPGGLGLGLAIVKHLVELHGGHVDARSDGPDRGSTFRVQLPIRAVQVEAPEQPRRQTARPEPGVLTAAPSLDGLRVLVVDDEEDARDLLTHVLEHFGAHALAASSATEALAAIAAQEFDVLLSDLGMPHQDGYQLIRTLREREAGGHLPAIALSAYATVEDAERALKAGFDRHIAKPVDAARLVAQVASLAAS